MKSKLVMNTAKEERVEILAESPHEEAIIKRMARHGVVVVKFGTEDGMPFVTLTEGTEPAELADPDDFFAEEEE